MLIDFLDLNQAKNRDANREESAVFGNLPSADRRVVVDVQNEDET